MQSTAASTMRCADFMGATERTGRRDRMITGKTESCSVVGRGSVAHSGVCR